MNKILFSCLILTLFFGALACDRQQRSARDCTYNGSEAFGLNVDGRFRGAFAEYVPAEGPNGIAIFRNGLIPAAADLRGASAELRDVSVFTVDKGKVTGGVADLIETQFITVNGLASKDDEGCLVVDELILEVGRTQAASGILTAPQQTSASDSSYIIDVDIIDGTGEDLQ